MWLVFAIFAPILYAIVHILDEYCIEDIFDKPFIGMITSAVATVTIMIALLPFVAPFALNGWNWDSGTMIVLSIFSGSLVMISQGLYFKALSYSEAGIVAAYWNLIPVIVAMCSLAIFHQTLYRPQYIGIILLVITSITFCLIDTKAIENRWITLMLMITASLFQAASYLIDEQIFKVIPFFQAFTLMTVGYSITGLTPLIFPHNYKTISINLQILLPYIKLFLFIEVLDLLGLMNAERAIDIGIPSLVSAFEGTIPIFTFIISLFFTYALPKYSSKRSIDNFGIKCVLVGCMILGIYLLN